jgi:hypothetical protein
MKPLDFYLQDPVVMAMPEYLREIHAIRRQIVAETTGMSEDEQVEHTHANVRRLLEKYGVKVQYAHEHP